MPADYGAAVWEAIYAAGQAHGMVEYGTETMHVLRAEKGYIIVGQDTDGTVTPDDAGLSWAIGKNKPDFVGKRSLERASMKAADRKQLVGLRTRDARHRARGRRADRGQGRPEAAHGADRPRDLVLFQQRLGLSDRARARRRRPRAHGPDAVRAHARRRHRSRSHLAGFLRPHRSAHQWLSRRMRRAPAGARGELAQSRCRRRRAGCCTAMRAHAPSPQPRLGRRLFRSGLPRDRCTAIARDALARPRRIPAARLCADAARSETGAPRSGTLETRPGRCPACAGRRQPPAICARNERPARERHSERRLPARSGPRANFRSACAPARCLPRPTSCCGAPARTRSTSRCGAPSRATSRACSRNLPRSSTDPDSGELLKRTSCCITRAIPKALVLDRLGRLI